MEIKTLNVTRGTTSLDTCQKIAKAISGQTGLILGSGKGEKQDTACFINTEDGAVGIEFYPYDANNFKVRAINKSGCGNYDSVSYSWTPTRDFCIDILFSKNRLAVVINIRLKTESSYYQKQFCAPIILAKNELGEYGGFTACRYKVDPQWEYVPKGYNNQSGFSVNPLFIRSPDVKTTITRGVDFYWGSVFSDLYFVQVQNSENELQNTTKIYEGETFFFVGGAGQSSGYSDRQKDTGQLMAIRV